MGSLTDFKTVFIVRKHCHVAFIVSNVLIVLLVQDPVEDPHQWWPNTECDCGGTVIMPQHTYLDTVIVLSSAVADWNTTVHQQNTNKPVVTTSDDGRTWHIDSCDT